MAEFDFLPVEFTEKMQKLLGDEFNSFIDCYKDKHNAGLRINTLKTGPEQIKELLPVDVSPVAWINNGFYYDECEQPAKHPFYYAGLYYIQEPSAMTPASLLPVKPGMKVLDLCAAPGGKSTELGAKLKGKGVLVANDISNSRAKALLKNIEVFGISNPIVVSEAPEKLTTVFEEYFDCILVDAPCSGEGMFRKSHAIIKNWQQYGTEYYAKLQRQILPNAVRMLKPGGYMIYSTCTFSVDEDEASLKFILDEYPDMHVVPAISQEDERFKGFVHADAGLVDGPEEINNALRLYPHRIKGEGHFVALLRKADAEGQAAEADAASEDSTAVSAGAASADSTAVNAGAAFADSTAVSASAAFADSRTAAISDLQEYEDIHGSCTNFYDEHIRKLHKDISQEAFDFFESLRFTIPAERLFVKEDRIYLLPEGIPNISGLRILRSGLLLGEMKKQRFEPSQALACALKMRDYDNVYNLEPDDPAAVSFLKCETLILPDYIKDGYVLVCVAGFPMGWGKNAGGKFKNKYLPGWRML